MQRENFQKGTKRSCTCAACFGIARVPTPSAACTLSGSNFLFDGGDPRSCDNFVSESERQHGVAGPICVDWQRIHVRRSGLRGLSLQASRRRLRGRHVDAGEAHCLSESSTPRFLVKQVQNSLTWPSVAGSSWTMVTWPCAESTRSPQQRPPLLRAACVATLWKEELSCGQNKAQMCSCF